VSRVFNELGGMKKTEIGPIWGETSRCLGKGKRKGRRKKKKKKRGGQIPKRESQQNRNWASGEQASTPGGNICSGRSQGERKKKGKVRREKKKVGICVGVT